MKISDLISVHDAARAIDLASLEELLQTLDREGADLTLGTATQLGELLGEYVAPEADSADPLRIIMDSIARNGERGGAFLVRGAGGAGKSHLLSSMALLLHSTTAWSAFLNAHPAYADLRQRLAGKPYVIVPVPLDEHRGHDEHLEDIVFDRTERALRSSRHGFSAPLSEQSYALDLIDRHIVPRYSEELDEYTRGKGTGPRSWKALRERSPALAVQMARQFAQEIQYPLDFRQSRVERISTLLDITRENQIAGIVWLVDDLNDFLSGVGPKAVHGDCSFLEFIGQRCKIAPLFMIATMDESLEQLTSVEPYLLNSIRSGYRTDLVLSPDHMRVVARRRVIGRVDPEAYGQAMSDVHAAYSTALDVVSFSPEQLAEAYPLHPTALECLESIAERFFGAADTLVAFMQDLLDQTNLAGVLQRDFRKLISVDDVFDYLRPRIASHPEVSAYIYDVMDYYQRSADEVFPEDPELCVRLIRALVVFRLANIAASVPMLAESIGLNEAGEPIVRPDRAVRALESMRLVGNFVDVRRGAATDGPAVYYVDTHTSLSETVRRRVSATKGSFGASDVRVWRHLVSACEDASFPLAQLEESRTLEVQWHNTFRCIAAQIVDLTTFPPGTIDEYVNDLSDPATVEDVCLFVLPAVDREKQLASWRSLCDPAPASRWSAAVLAWLPRELTPQEVDRLKEFAAVTEMLSDEKSLAAEGGLREQLLEVYGPALEQARKIARKAYYGGEILSPFGPVLSSGELEAADGNWAQSLQAATARAFERVFPDFASIAPRRPLIAREQIDALVNQVIRPGGIALPPDDPLAELIRSTLVPLGVVAIRDDGFLIDVSNSKVAADIMARVRQRDQTPQHETGRPIACSDLAQHLVKAPLGLPPELFELVVTALIRCGYLAAMRDRGQLMRFEDITTPVSASIQYVARPPLLTPGEWQILARVCRIALDLSLQSLDYAVQQRTWERLVQARTDYTDQAESLRQRLAAHVADLEQRPAQWSEAFADIDALENAFRCVRPELHLGVGLREFIRDISGFIGDAQGSSRLSGLLRRIDLLKNHLEKLAPDIVEVRNYLLSPTLSLGRGTDLEARRQSVLELIGTGEEMLTEEMNLRRQVQIFLATYKRAYISWHGRVYRSPIFDQYRGLYQSVEMRVLNQLSKLHIDVTLTADEMSHRIEEQVRRRCTRQDLNEVLDTEPTCPDCRLPFNEEPELLAADTLIDEARQAVAGYIAAILAPQVSRRVREYAAAIPKPGDLRKRLEQIPDLTEDASPREILTLFTDETISHINRAFSGKVLAPRNFAQLRKTLEGRTITKEEAQDLFKLWLDGEGEEVDDDGLLQIGG